MMNPSTRLTKIARAGIGPAIEMQFALIQEIERLQFQYTSLAVKLSAIDGIVNAKPDETKTPGEQAMIMVAKVCEAISPKAST